MKYIFASFSLPANFQWNHMSCKKLYELETSNVHYKYLILKMWVDVSRNLWRRGDCESGRQRKYFYFAIKSRKSFPVVRITTQQVQFVVCVIYILWVSRSFRITYVCLAKSLKRIAKDEPDNLSSLSAPSKPPLYGMSLKPAAGWCMFKTAIFKWSKLFPPQTPHGEAKRGRHNLCTRDRFREIYGTLKRAGSRTPHKIGSKEKSTRAKLIIPCYTLYSHELSLLIFSDKSTQHQKCKCINKSGREVVIDCNCHCVPVIHQYTRNPTVLIFYTETYPENRQHVCNRNHYQTTWIKRITSMRKPVKHRVGMTDTSTCEPNLHFE